MSRPLMKCGHTANAVNSVTGKPVCAICVGLTPDAEVVNENPPDLTGRVAKCYCGATKPSSFDLAFFEYRPDKAWDSYYCGHAGWD